MCGVVILVGQQANGVLWFGVRVVVVCNCRCLVLVGFAVDVVCWLCDCLCVGRCDGSLLSHDR